MRRCHCRRCHSLPVVQRQWKGCEYVCWDSPSPSSYLLSAEVSKWVANTDRLPSLADYTSSNLSETGLTSRLSQVWLIKLNQASLGPAIVGLSPSLTIYCSHPESGLVPFLWLPRSDAGLREGCAWIAGHL